MNVEHLVQMANQIGAFFSVEPDPKIGAESVANHIKRFWEPRMRRLIVEHVDEHNGDGLTDLVKTAIQSNRAKLI